MLNIFIAHLTSRHWSNLGYFTFAIAIPSTLEHNAHTRSISLPLHDYYNFVFSFQLENNIRC